jgi:4-aminobutyrate aminotransferase/(S)-3-amino-2-methylpropionate transaminase
MLRVSDEGVVPDVLCLGKGLGGGLPISACIGKDSVMRAWRRDAEVVQTSTFAGAPLACATAIATLDTLSRDGLCARSRDVGNRFRAELAEALSRSPANVQVRGDGLMIGVDLGGGPGSASIAAQRLLERGYIASTGGGGREVLVLTPPLNISEPLLLGAISELAAVLDGPSA